MPQFHETGYGRRFFEGQLPQLIDALKDISKSMKEQGNEVVVHVNGGIAHIVKAPPGVKVKIIDWDEVRDVEFELSPISSRNQDGSLIIGITNEKHTVTEMITLKEPLSSQFKALSDDRRIKLIREKFPEQVLLIGSYID